MNSVTTINSGKLLANYIETFNNHDIEGVAKFLADDFVFHVEPQPLNAAQFLGVLQVVQDAFPDNTMRLKLQSVEGHQAALLFNNSGTHTGDLDLRPLGGTVIPPTGKSYKLPEGIFDYTVGEEGITAVHPRPNPGGGFAGILSQLGLG